MIQDQHISSKCPNNCGNVFKLKQRGLPILNDSGGWKLKCNSCSHEFIIHVLNPVDLSYVESGVEIVDMREGTLAETEKWCKEEGIPIQPVETLIYQPEDLGSIKFDVNAHSLYTVDSGDRIEKLAYDALQGKMDVAKAQNRAYFNWYVKGRQGDPKFSYILIEFESSHGKHTAVFYYNFTRKGPEDFPSSIDEVLLCHVTNCHPLDLRINGVYTRNECLDLLNKMLIRWRGLYKHLVMVVPFVGYLNQNAKTRIKLWDDIKRYLLEPNAVLLTRHVAKSLLEKSELKEGIPSDLLKAFEVESDAFQNTELFNLFHAKFFAGVNHERSEVLKGSFNIQKNVYYENLDCSEMQTDFFQSRYLDPLRINLEDKEELKEALLIDLRDENPKTEVVWGWESGIDIIEKI